MEGNEGQEGQSVISDLHVHSEYSDGSNTPEEIFEMARTLGIRDLALTDHDTTHWLTQSGLDAYYQAETFGISLIRGIEVSAKDYSTGKKAHILGYWPGCESFVPVHLLPFCRTMQARRTEVSRMQVKVLQNLGLPVTISEIEGVSKADQVFKHQILRTLFDKGLIDETMGDFYRQHFRRGGDCFFEIEYVPAQDVVAAILADHGYPVLAHPGQQKNFESVPALTEAGLMGIEYLHPAHTQEDRSSIISLSKEFGLFKTAGSDYHGAYHQSRSLGSCSLSKDDRDELVKIGLLQKY